MSKDKNGGGVGEAILHMRIKGTFELRPKR